MLETETLKFRASMLQALRNFFTSRSYIELDTPSVSPALIPDSTCEVFRAAYDDPWTDEEKDIYLVPSHEYFLKKAVAAMKTPVFQLSKCFRNCESTGRLNSPEFTLLEFYTPGTSYTDSATIIEELITSLTETVPQASSADKADEAGLAAELPRPPFVRLTMDEAFKTYAGFPLSECTSEEGLAEKAREAGIPEFPDNPFDDWPMDELFELILSQCVEPALPKDRGIFIMDRPAFVPSLAKEKQTGAGKEKKPAFWKEQWTLYVSGVKVAVSRSEETDVSRIKAYLESEGRIKNATARVKHTIDDSFWKTYESFPECSGTELHVDRLIMLLARKKSIENIIPFPFRLKTGYY